MLTYQGKYNKANVMIDEIDESTVTQIYNFLNNPAFEGANIVIMPDCHAGAGAVVGYTATINSYVIPNLIGVDIGCGVEAFNLGKIDIDFAKLDEYIRKHIPSGFAVNEHAWHTTLAEEREVKHVTENINHVEDYERYLKSIGTLGGGNHFIEIDQAPNGDMWLLIHSGSRKFGLDIAKFHQQKAKALMREEYVGAAFRDLEFLSAFVDTEAYKFDMQVAQGYAMSNRMQMMKILVEYCLKLHRYEGYLGAWLDGRAERIVSVHNYINFEDKIIRKGAISAHKDQRLVIPLNMRDGIIVGRGKGNKDWNYSAPHGAGRIYSRKQAKKNLSLEEFQLEMTGIWSSCIKAETLDESPMAYKDKQKIIDAIGDTVDIEFIMKPVYNFKAVE